MKDKVAIVTGGNSGIGRATALALALSGMKVVIAGRREDANAEVVKEIKSQAGADVVAMKVDVSQESECRKLIDDTVKQFGRLDVLVNNAGVFSVGELDGIETSEIDKVMKTNVYGPVWCAKAAISAMEKNKNISDASSLRGHIINIASIAGKEGFGGLGTYCASKHALMGFSKCMSDECASKMIKVSDICPGYVATPMVLDSAPVAANEMIQPEDIAKTVLYLLSLSDYCHPREVVVGRIEGGA